MIQEKVVFTTGKGSRLEAYGRHKAFMTRCECDQGSLKTLKPTHSCCWFTSYEGSRCGGMKTDDEVDEEVEMIYLGFAERSCR